MVSRQKPDPVNQRDRILSGDANDLRRVLGELVRAYQFRDRRSICCHDISVTQCYAIDVLVKQGSLAISQLAGRLFLDKSTTSRVVDSLERKGYVSRTADPDDGRALKLEVTGTGRNLHRRIERDLTDEMREMLSGLDPETRRTAIDLVGRLAKRAKEKSNDAGTGRDTCDCGLSRPEKETNNE